MKRALLIATVVLLIASACTSGADESTTTMPPDASTPFVGQSEAETAWCTDFNNFPAIAQTAIAEQVDGYESLEAERVRILEGLGESFLSNFLGGFVELEWRPRNAEGFAQACTAAFESR